MYINKNVFLAILSTIILIFSGVGVYAAIQSNDTGTTIYGCMDNKKGDLKIVNAGTACGKGESPISWNTVGPKGDKGDKGDVGQIGPQGPAGPIRASLVDFSGGLYKSFFVDNVPLDTSSNTIFTITIPKGGIYRLDLITRTSYAGVVSYRASITGTLSGDDIVSFVGDNIVDIKYDPTIPVHFNTNFALIDTSNYNFDSQYAVVLYSTILQKNAPVKAQVDYKYALTKLQ